MDERVEDVSGGEAMILNNRDDISFLSFSFLFFFCSVTFARLDAVFLPWREYWMLFFAMEEGMIESFYAGKTFVHFCKRLKIDDLGILFMPIFS
jgi:hypothetical protein